uniref:Uncharacterized protein n=1 Tax=Ditylenchus dipsaci TaxID=166011 RepID=A0A915EBJ4_9BILA
MQIDIAFKKLILIILLVFASSYLIICLDNAENSFRTDKFYVNADNVDVFHYRVAVIALMKAKAKSVLLQLPPTEKYVYQQCESDASTPNTLARCLVSLFNARDNFLETSRLLATSINSSSTISTDQPISAVLNRENTAEDSWLSLLAIEDLTKSMLASMSYSPKEAKKVEIKKQDFNRSVVSMTLKEKIGKFGALLVKSEMEMKKFQRKPYEDAKSILFGGGIDEEFKIFLRPIWKISLNKIFEK